MATLTEGARTAEFIISEANDHRSRDNVTVTIPPGGLEAGTVLGFVTARRAYARYFAEATNGQETVAGIAYKTCTEEGDTAGVVITRDAEVDGSKLIYEAGANAAAINVTNAGLVALGIIVR